jgi:hypothetical protein
MGGQKLPKLYIFGGIESGVRVFEDEKCKKAPVFRLRL